MEIDKQIFDSLLAWGVLDKRHAQSIQEEQKKVNLRREAAVGIENGVFVGSYFTHIAKLMVTNKQDVSSIDLEALKSLKNAVTSAAKLYNWGILLKEIEVLKQFYIHSSRIFTYIFVKTNNQIFINRKLKSKLTKIARIWSLQEMWIWSKI